MLELCEILKINVNELLSGERLDMEDYKNKAEENLVEIRTREESANKELLRIEVVIGMTCTISFLIMIFTAIFAVTDTVWKILLFACGILIFAVGIYYALKIERNAGYYECADCGYRYVPSFKAVLFAFHVGRSRRMKCPHCGKRNYHRKVLTR